MNKQVTNFDTIDTFVGSFVGSFVFEEFTDAQVQHEVELEASNKQGATLPSSRRGLEEVKALLSGDLEGSYKKAFGNLPEEIFSQEVPEVTPAYSYSFKEGWKGQKYPDPFPREQGQFMANNRVMASVLVVETMARLLKGSGLPSNKNGETVSKITVGTSSHDEWFWNNSSDKPKVLPEGLLRSWASMKEDIIESISLMGVPVNIFEESFEDVDGYFHDVLDRSNGTTRKAVADVLLGKSGGSIHSALPSEKTGKFLESHPHLAGDEPKLAITLYSVAHARKNPQHSFLVWEGARDAVIEYYGSECQIPENLFFTDFWSHGKTFADWEISYDEMKLLLQPLCDATVTSKGAFIRMEENEATKNLGRNFTLWFEDNWSFTIAEEGKQVWDQRGRFAQKVLVEGPLLNTSRDADPTGFRVASEADLLLQSSYGIFLEYLLSMSSYLKANDAVMGADKLARKGIAGAPFWCADEERGGSTLGERREYEKTIAVAFSGEIKSLNPRFKVNENGAAPLTLSGEGEGWRSYTVRKERAKTLVDKPAMQKYNLVRMHKGSQSFNDASVYHSRFSDWGNPVQAFLNVLHKCGFEKALNDGDEVSLVEVIHRLYGVACNNEKEAEHVIGYALYAINTKLAKLTKRAGLLLPTSARVCALGGHIAALHLGTQQVLVDHGSTSGPSEIMEYNSAYCKSAGIPGQSYILPGARYAHPNEVPQTIDVPIEGFAFDKDGAPAVDFVLQQGAVSCDGENVEYNSTISLEQETSALWSFKWDQDLTIGRPDNGDPIKTTGMLVKKGTVLVKMGHVIEGVRVYNEITAPMDMVVQRLIFKAEKSGDKIYGLNAKVKGFEVNYFSKLRGELKTVPVMPSNGAEVIYNDLNGKDLLPFGIQLVAMLDANKSFTDLRGCVMTMAQTAAHTSKGRKIIRSINERFFKNSSELRLPWSVKVAQLKGYQELEDYILANYSKMIWTKEIAPKDGVFSQILLAMYQNLADHPKEGWVELQGDDRSQVEEFADGHIPSDAKIFIHENGGVSEHAHILAFYKEGENDVLAQKTLSLVGSPDPNVGHLVSPLKGELSAISQILSESDILPNVANTVANGLAGGKGAKPNPELAAYLTQDANSKPKRWAVFTAMLNKQKLFTEHEGSSVVLPTVPLFVEGESGSAINPELVEALRNFDHGRLARAARLHTLTFEDVAGALANMVIDADIMTIHLPTILQQEGEPTSRNTFAGMIKSLFNHILATDKNATSGARFYLRRAKGSLESLCASDSIRKMRGAKGVYGKIGANYMVPIDELWVLYSENPKSYYQFLVKVAKKHGISEEDLDGTRGIFSRMPMPFACGVKIRVIYPGEWGVDVDFRCVDDSNTDYLISQGFEPDSEEVKQQMIAAELALEEIRDKQATAGRVEDVMDELMPLLNPFTAYIEAGDWDGDDRLFVPVNGVDVELISVSKILAVLKERTGKDPLSVEAEGDYIRDQFDATPSKKKQFKIGGGMGHFTLNETSSWMKALELAYKGSLKEIHEAFSTLQEMAPQSLLYTCSTGLQGQSVGVTHRIANVSAYAWSVFNSMSTEVQAKVDVQPTFFHKENWNLVGFEVYENPLGGFGWQIYQLCRILADGGTAPQSDKKGNQVVRFSDFFDLEKLVEEAGLNSSEILSIDSAAYYVQEDVMGLSSGRQDLTATPQTPVYLIKVMAALMFLIDKGQLNLELTEDLSFDQAGHAVSGNTHMDMILWYLTYKGSWSEKEQLRKDCLVVRLVDEYIHSVLPAFTSGFPEWAKFLNKKGVTPDLIEGNRLCKGISAVEVSLDLDTSKHQVPATFEKKEVTTSSYELSAPQQFLLEELRTRLPKTKFKVTSNYTEVLTSYIAPLVSGCSEDQVVAIHKFFFGDKESPLSVISGAGGTGKSYTTECVVEILRHCTNSAVVLAASSGTAAKNLSPDAITFGSLSGQGVDPICPLGVVHPDYNSPADLMPKLKRRVDLDPNLNQHVVMVIDEISMISSEELWVFMETARLAFNSNFGSTSGQYPEQYGFSILGVGDMPQLSPVQGTPAYKPAAFELGNGVVTRPDIFDFYKVNLAGLYINHRVNAKGGEFAQQLIDISEGKEVKANSPIGSRIFRDAEVDVVNGRGLFLSNKEAKAFNAKVSSHLASEGMASKTYSLSVLINGRWWTVADIDHDLHYAMLIPHEGTMANAWKGRAAYAAIDFLPPWVEHEMRLYEGMQYMFRENDAEKRWANGSVGTIKRLLENSIIVELNGSEVEVPVQRSINAVYQEGKLRKAFKGLLGHPAHAITVQKSQGLTFKEGEVSIHINNPSLAAKSPGLVYVALSRVADVKQLKIIVSSRNALKAVNESISADDGAVDFRHKAEATLKEYAESLDFHKPTPAEAPKVEEFDGELELFTIEEADFELELLSLSDGDRCEPVDIFFDKGEFEASHPTEGEFTASDWDSFKVSLETLLLPEDIKEIEAIYRWFNGNLNKKVISTSGIDYTYEPMEGDSLEALLHNEVQDCLDVLTVVEESKVATSFEDGKLQIITPDGSVDISLVPMALNKAKMEDGTVLLGTPSPEYAVTSLPKGFVWYYISTAIKDGETLKKDVISIKITFSPEELVDQMQYVSEEALLKLYKEIKAGWLPQFWFYTQD